MASFSDFIQNFKEEITYQYFPVDRAVNFIFQNRFPKSLVRYVLWQQVTCHI